MIMHSILMVHVECVIKVSNLHGTEENALEKNKSFVRILDRDDIIPRLIRESALHNVFSVHPMREPRMMALSVVLIAYLRSE